MNMTINNEYKNLMNKYMYIFFLLSFLIIFIVYWMYPYIDAKIKLYLIRYSSNSNPLEGSPYVGEKECKSSPM